jgi:lambda repressor-like predicted transcriptional regulator
MPGNIEIYDPPSSHGGDYIVQIKVRNGPMLRAIRLRKMKIKDLHEQSGVSATIIYRFLALSLPPLLNGKWRNAALKIAEVLRLPPDSLWPEEHLDRALARSTGELEVSRDEMQMLLVDNEYGTPEEREVAIASLVKVMSKTLLPRDERVLRLRFGIGVEPHTLGETADKMSLSRERVRQMESRAIRRLQYKPHIKALMVGGAKAFGIDGRRGNPLPERHYEPEWRTREEKRRRLIDRFRAMCQEERRIRQEERRRELASLDEMRKSLDHMKNWRQQFGLAEYDDRIKEIEDRMKQLGV